MRLYILVHISKAGQKISPAPALAAPHASWYSVNARQRLTQKRRNELNK